MGYDPFEADAEGVPIGTVHAVIARSPKGLTGTYDLVDLAGEKRWTRTYTEPSTVYEACRGVHEGIAVALTNQFQGFEIEGARKVLATLPAPAPKPPPAPEPLEPAPEPPKDAPPAKSTSVYVEVGGGGLVSYGFVPAPSFGGLGHLGVQFVPVRRGPWFSLAAEGRAEASLAQSLDSRYGLSSVRATMIAGSGVACVHQDMIARGDFVGSIFGGVAGTGGVVHFSYEDSRPGGPASSRAAYGAVGVRVGAEARISPRVALRLHSTISGTLGTARATGMRSPLVLRSPGGGYDAGIQLLFLFGGSPR